MNIICPFDVFVSGLRDRSMKGLTPLPKGNVIALLEFELTYYDIVIQYFSHYSTGIPRTC